MFERHFENVDPTDVQNPMKYWCAPNEATYDCVPAHDLPKYISAMFFHCYIAPEDTSMQYDKETLYWIREDFLDCLEVALLTVTPSNDIPLWEAVIHDDAYLPYDRPDGGVWVEPKEDDKDQDGCHVIWKFKGTEPTTNEELDVLRFDFCWDLYFADDQAYWLGSDAIENLDIGNIQSIINEAREINQKIREAVQE